MLLLKRWIANYRHTFPPRNGANHPRRPPGEFTDNFVQLEDLWPQHGKELKARLGEFESASHHIKTLRDAIKPLDGAINPIQRAIQEISLAHGDVDLDHLNRSTSEAGHLSNLLAAL